MFLSQQKFWNDLQWELGTHFDKWARIQPRYHYFHKKCWPPPTPHTLTQKKGGMLTFQISFQHLSCNITRQIFFQFLYKNFPIPFPHWLPWTTYKTNTTQWDAISLISLYGTLQPFLSTNFKFTSQTTFQFSSLSNPVPQVIGSNLDI